MPREPEPSTICAWPRWPSTFSSGSDTCGTEPGNGTSPPARSNGGECAGWKLVRAGVVGGVGSCYRSADLQPSTLQLRKRKLNRSTRADRLWMIGVSGGAIGYHLAGRGSGVIGPDLSWT